ncbi:MAG: amidase [Rhodospirillales bacterium]
MFEPKSLSGMGLIEAAETIREGTVTSRQLVDDCLARIDEHDPAIKAWAHLKPDHAREQADACDKLRRTGKVTGPLHGVPIGIKDIIDTAHVPTEYGSKIFKGRVPFNDAWVVSRLRNLGAIIIGKTVTAELANVGPNETRNPHDTSRTPGGSSSGSAAAVASYMVPGALGTQTGGSVIRPASYCGIYGFKPTWGLIPRSGVLLQSHILDHVGTFGRSVADAALLAECLMGYDPDDPATSVVNYPQPLAEICRQEPPVGVKLGFARTPKWNEAEPATQEAFEELCEVLGDEAEDLDLTGTFENAWEWHRTLMNADNAFHYGAIYDKSGDQLHPDLRANIEHGRTVTATQYLGALQGRERLLEIWDEMLEEYDAIITPAAAGEAPEGLQSTGDAVFCKLWSLMGVPAVSLPLMVGENGMPLGVQLVGRVGDDAKLLRTANWLVETLSQE